MTLIDAYGLATSSANAKCVELYQAALHQLQSYLGDPVATIDEALAEDPDFVLGHIFRAEAYIGAWEASVLQEIEKSLRRLDELDNQANERERAHTHAIRAWAEGDWNGMRARLERLSAEYPRDVLALQIGHLTDFYHGDRDNLRNRIARSLPSLTAADPGYGFFLGMYAFGLEECGEYARAEETARQAIAHEPDDCWAHHAIAHVMEMQARQAEGIAWMEGSQAHWAQADNGFAFHNWWHTALYNLDQDHIERAIEIYDTCIHPEPVDMQLEMLDAAALLWRLFLRGIDVGDRWSELATTFEKVAGAGFYVFNDMHAVMAYVGAGRDAAAAKLLAEVERQVEADGTNAFMTREVGLPVVRAFVAFGRAAYDETVALLLPVRNRAYVFGGSHAQRDVIHRTLIEAALRGNEAALATALTRERTALKPHWPFSWSLRRRAEQA